MMAIGAITDEFSPDLDIALEAMAALDMTTVELRMVSGRNIIDLSDREIDRVCDAVHRRNMTIVSIASPLLKCVLPDAPPIDTRFQQDVFASSHTFDDQPRLTDRAFAIATRTGARIIRVFSYWRTVEPDRCFDRIVGALGRLATTAAAEGVTIGLENEHACNIGTGGESARVLDAIRLPSLGLVWDPANALVAGETPYPDGYRRVGVSRIAHVHAKDCRVTDHTPEWGPLGEMSVDWTGQVEALRRDGYHGAINLETHWGGPGGDKLQASRICGARLRALVRA